MGGITSSAGDINGDGIDDMIIGAYRASPNDNSGAGSSYVVFGSTSGLANPLNLASTQLCRNFGQALAKATRQKSLSIC